MSRRDSKRESTGGRRALPDRSDEFRDFWEHPGRPRHQGRKPGDAGSARRSDGFGNPGVSSERRSGTIAADRPLPWERQEEQAQPRAERFVPGVYARTGGQGQVRPAPPPKALRSMRRTTDGMTAGALAIGFLVGLSMLAVVENELLNGGPTDPVSAQSQAPDPAKPTKQRRTTPVRPAEPPAPAVNTLGQRVGDLTEQLRGPAAKQSYGADKPPLTGPIRFNANRTWAFGTTAIPVPADRPAMPHVGLYLAQWAGDRWRIALSGTTEFARLLRKAPAQLLPADERRLLARYSAVSSGAAAKPTDLMLPWRVGGTWRMDADSSDRGPLSAVSFSGGTGNVLSAGVGRVYRFCTTAPGRGMVMVVHPNGLASTYYHLTNVIQVRDGSPVKRGTPLGRVGVDRPCGGAPVDAPQVRFSLRRGNEDVPFDGVQLGGWTFRERANPLLGWAERGLLQVLPGGLMRNFGPVAPPSEPKLPGLPTDPPGEGQPDPSQSPAANQER
jgi:murein DD-endopeptidase MepM/ murein hydrolase activator NlpD